MTRFRARSSLIYSSIVMGACAVIAVLVLVGGGWYEARPALGFLAALSAVAYVAYFRPSVDVYADRVALVNIVTIATVPFSRLSSIGTRWALELVADDASKATAFAAPAPGAMKARTITAHQEHFDPDIASLIYSGGPGTSTATASGAAAHMVDDAYQAWQKTGPVPSVSAATQPADASAAVDTPVTTASAAENTQAPQTATAQGRAITRRPHWLSIAVLVAGLALLALSLS